MRNAEASAALQDKVWASLIPVSASLAALYAVFAVSHGLLLPSAIRIAMVAVAVLTVIALLILTLALRCVGALKPFAYPIAFVVMLLASGNSALHLHLTQDLLHTTNVMLIVFGAGFFVLSSPWYFLTVGVNLCSWGFTAADISDSTLFVHFAFALLSTTLVSIVLHFVHVRDLAENYRLRICAEKQQRKMEYLATHDALTGLANRRKFLERLGLETAHANRTGRKVGVLYIDLNNFKSMNDTYGHEYGDEVLKLVARRLSATARKTDLATRLGGDEFAMLLTDLKAARDADVVVAKILASFKQPETIQAIDTRISLSIGRAVLPDETEAPDELLRIADQRMYAHKKQIKGELSDNAHDSA